MITLDSADVYGDSVFCDEIRVENTGKFLYIGVYGGRMYVHGASFPMTLPRLGIAITYAQRPAKFMMPIKFVVFLPGDSDEKPSIEAELPEDPMKEALASAQKFQAAGLDPANSFATVHANFNFTNLPIAKPGLLKVRAVRGEALVRLGTLLIEPAPPAQTSPPS